MDQILIKILGNFEFITEFDNELLKDNLSFYYKKDNYSSDFIISITEKNKLFELVYGFDEDIHHEYTETIWITEEELINAFINEIKQSFIRYIEYNNY